MTYVDKSLQSAHRSKCGVLARPLVFFLLPTYSPMDVSIAIETMHEANQSGANPAYTWRIHSESGHSFPSRSGITIDVNGGLDEVAPNATIILCGGNVMGGSASPNLLNWLRKSVRHGASLGSFGSGCAVLAQAGLLPEQNSVAAHWAISSAMREVFPQVDIRQQVYEKSSKLMTCAGGLASLDMFIALIAEDQGNHCAQQTADALVCSSVRDAENEQTLSLHCRMGVQSAHLVTAIKIMQNNIETPLSPAQIANEIGVSCRQLERLFAKYLGTSPKSYCTKLRLEQARMLLQQTSMSILEVAVACGFRSTATFSKLYRRRFDVTPSGERGIPRLV